MRSYCGIDIEEAKSFVRLKKHSRQLGFTVLKKKDYKRTLKLRNRDQKGKSVKITRGKSSSHIFNQEFEVNVMDMEEEPHKIEDAESKSNKSKSKSVKITRELSKPILASPCPKKPNKADPTGTIEISDTPANVQYERRLKYKNESQGSRVAENQRRVVNEELEFPKKRSIIDDNTNKDVPPKFRRVQPRRSSSTPEVPVSKPELQKKARDRNILDSSSNDGGDDTVDKWKEQFKLENDIRPKGLLYLEGLRFDGVDVEKGRPSICCWNASTMRLREELEMASGPFGMGVIHEIVGREETQEMIEFYIHQ
ncbi:hypothetical protein L2E82_14512 [Cichorium intybus]|uniref:Uncharacterized protein n=1 Tax=Cichorium intybus TaxID=13427 RepID=A0ACB9F0T5_CICIN|nr:hypothetical protein L2E82_14512 [Cichorium intybus]